MEMLGQLIKDHRLRKRWSQDHLAKYVGVSRPAVGQWEAGDTAPSMENLMKVCEGLGISPEEAVLAIRNDDRVWNIKTLDMVEILAEERTKGKNAGPETRRAILSQFEMPKNVPVLGVAVGGEQADFYTQGEIIDLVRRPPGAGALSSVYALYVVGSSMSPRYEEGELIYLSQARTPSIGDYVVVELKPKKEGDLEGAGFLKKLVKRTTTTLVCEQFNPPKELVFALDDIKTLHRVIPWTELLGI